MLRIDDWDQCRVRCDRGETVEGVDKVSEPYVRYIGGLVKYCPTCNNRLVQGRCMDCGGVEVDYGEEASLQGSSDTE